MASAKKFLGGFILGIAIGTILGVLYAPKKGYKTRKLIAKKATGLKDTAQWTYRQAKELLGKDKEKNEPDIANSLEQVE
jgi:gas vesicle protein